MVASLDKPVVCPILIGRAVYRESLNYLIGQVHDNPEALRVALIAGEAGLGKSRLVAETRAYARELGLSILQGHCFEPDRSLPYAPFLDLLRTFFAGHSPAEIARDLGPAAPEIIKLLPELAPLLPDLTPTRALEPEQEKRRLFQALSQFFTSPNLPLLVIVEDIHWSDDTSLEFLLYLARQTISQPLLLLLTYRSDETHPALMHFLARLDREHLATELTLAPLDLGETEAMLQAIFELQRPVRADFLEAIYTLTEGNPFFIEEILKSLIAAGDIFYTEGAWDRKPMPELRIPRSVQDAVQRRTTQLSPAARQLLSLAAVMGRRFDFTLLQALTQREESDLLQLIKELIGAQLVAEASAEQFTFRHALTREAVYATLLARERRVLHRTIAEVLERIYADSLDGPVVDLAYHFYEANDWEKTMVYSQQAGEKAQSLYASRLASEYFTHALEAAHQLAVKPPLQLYRNRGQAYETLGEFDRAQSDYQLALDEAQSDRSEEWQALLSLGFLWLSRDYTEAGSYFRRALEAARALGDPVTLAHSLNRMGNWYVNVEQPLEALRYHKEALTMFEKMPDLPGIATTLDLLGMASYLGGDLRGGTQYYERAVFLFQEVDDRQGLVSSLATLTLRGATYQTNTMVPATVSLPVVAHEGELALRIAQEISWRSGEAYAMIFLGFCLGPQGEYSRALKLGQDGLHIAGEIEHRQWMIAAHCVLGALHLDLLALEIACQHLEQALALAHITNSLHWTHCATGYLASTYILQQEFSRAESLLHAALSLDTSTQTLGQRLAWCAQAELSLARGDPSAALQIIDRLTASAASAPFLALGEGDFSPRAQAEGGEEVIPRLAKLRGEALSALQQWAEAEAALQAAQSEALRQEVQPLLWRIHLAFGNLYRAQARREEAQHAFAEARTIIEEVAAKIPDEYVTALPKAHLPNEASSLRDNFLRRATASIPALRPLSQRQAAKVEKRRLRQAFGGLTPREREVAALIAQGKSNREIATELSVGLKTVEAHISRILTKLEFSSRAQIASWAVGKGLAVAPQDSGMQKI